MQVRLLGPVDIVVDGQPRTVHGLRRKAVLATLALQHGDLVSIDQLIDVVWGEAAPATARNTLQSHVSYLRTVLGGKTAIRARPPGYVLELRDGTDVLRVRQLMRLARQADAPAEQARQLAAALSLWRGQPLADVEGVPWLDGQAERLQMLRVDVARALSDARLAAGEHRELIPSLEPLAAERPLDEQVQAQLMLALYRSGRQADALAVYERTRRALADQLGVDPGQSLRELELAILRQDPALDVTAELTRTGRGAAAVPVPAQLPPGPPFAGRRDELAGLDALLTASSAAPDDGPGGAAISVLSGTAGVGKTALAVHWARRMSARFPDGQLFASLRGFDPAGAALEPGDALRGFLEAFGIPEARIPADLAGQAGLYRSVLAGKRVLVVLDNARDERQVRPLLPASPGCVAVITSRNRLVGLVAAEGASPLTLDLLSPEDARELLTSRLGATRVTSEPAAVSDIIDGCARLPLALTVAAARAVTTPHLPLAAIASELRGASRALDPFYVGDTASDVRAVLSWSYRALTGAAARLFRLLGLHPGPDVSLAAAASLGALRPDQAREVLAELTRGHLLAEHEPGRYAFHDLLRAYAAEQARDLDRQGVRDAAVHRLLDHYLHSAYASARLIEPLLERLALGEAEPGTVLAEPAKAADAMAWFAAEQAGILGAVQLAAEGGLAAHAWQLAWIVSSYYLRRGLWEDNTAAQQAALGAARAAGDVPGEAHAVHGLANGYARSGRFDLAVPKYERALGLCQATGDHANQARIQASLAWIAESQERLTDAAGHAAAALALYQAAGDRPGEATGLNDLGFCYARMGNFREALSYCERGLAICREVGERNWEAATLDSLGLIHDGLGDRDRAVACYEQAAAIYRDLGDRFNEADTLMSLGDVLARAGGDAAARARWAQAVAIFDEIGHPDGDEARARLEDAELRPRAEGETPGAGTPPGG
jgi:DNA-binding SARP family transcriptional activator/Tfp pilus assembly protein PilF